MRKSASLDPREPLTFKLQGQQEKLIERQKDSIAGTAPVCSPSLESSRSLLWSPCQGHQSIDLLVTNVDKLNVRYFSRKDVYLGSIMNCNLVHSYGKPLAGSLIARKRDAFIESERAEVNKGSMAFPCLSSP